MFCACATGETLQPFEGRTPREETRSGLVKITLPPFPLGVVSFPNGKAMNLSVNVGAGAFHQARSDAQLIWTTTNGGPVVPCRASKTLIGLDAIEFCGGNLDAKVALLPGFAPTIYGIEIDAANAAHVIATLPVKDRSGRPLSGLSDDDPDDSSANFDLNGKHIASDKPGVNPGGIVRLTDGSFWLSESHGPSLLHVAADGTVIARIVPGGAQEDYHNADYQVLANLPAAFGGNLANAAFDCLALSPDEHFLYLALKAPPPQADDRTAASDASPLLRIVKFDLAANAVTAEFPYRLDAPETFRSDQARYAGHQRDVRLIEMIALAEDRLMTIERIARSAHILVVDLKTTQTLPARYDDIALEPGFESMGTEQFLAAGSDLPQKRIIFDSDTLEQSEAAKHFERLEAAALMSERDLILLTDNAYGLEGERSRMYRLTLPKADLN